MSGPTGELDPEPEPDPALEREIHELPDFEAPPGWQAAVNAALDNKPARRTPDRDRPVVPKTSAGVLAAKPVIGIAAGAAALAAAMVIYLATRRPPLEGVTAVKGPPRKVPTVALIALDGTGQARSAAAAVIGDRLVARAGSSGVAELRIYRDDRDVVLRCRAATDPGCRADGKSIVGEHEVSAPGTYRAVVFVVRVPEPSGSLSVDLAGHDERFSVSTPIVVE